MRPAVPARRRRGVHHTALLSMVAPLLCLAIGCDHPDATDLPGFAGSRRLTTADGGASLDAPPDLTGWVNRHAGQWTLDELTNQRTYILDFRLLPPDDRPAAGSQVNVWRHADSVVLTRHYVIGPDDAELPSILVGRWQPRIADTVTPPVRTGR